MAIRARGGRAIPSIPFATREASRCNSAYVVRRTASSISDAETIATFAGSAGKQLSAMFISAPGSHSGCVTAECGSRTLLGRFRKRIPSFETIVDQNSSR